MKQIDTYSYQATQGEQITFDAPKGSALAIAGLNLRPAQSSGTREFFTFKMTQRRVEVVAGFGLIPNPQDSYLNISGGPNQYSIDVNSSEHIILSFDSDYPGPK